MLRFKQGARVKEHEVVLILVSMVIFAGVGVLWLAMASRRAFREMEHRERLAMIQRGLVPSPESDPLGFEMQVEPFHGDSLKAERWRTAGTLIIGLGAALMVLLTFTAGDVSLGFGVGGAFAVLGAAFLLSSYQQQQRRPRPGRLSARRPFSEGPIPPPDPPSSFTS
jgi:hypothetical protein